MLDQKHPLYVLANLIDWNMFESEFKKHYCSNNGRPSKPIRLMVGLLMLKHIRSISDESAVEQANRIYGRKIKLLAVDHFGPLSVRSKAV